ncbi:hypothetical protein [Rathayibacter toxicus]|uniref:Uncharacterized protein n=2 Tax=Rathayibacter toxicus TaxID=145458 RepID=A0A0C5BGB6_9MICO|nr:hypothetical protein [Rathayibacter toxicus]AJM77265.1 hypothetical protein TI83_03405 [Rathayibacter toxicus]ALS56872.1 hypothetical protein APU90_03070 [Rathayibacter toxicus]KKM46288.1 hypothetical protein VT73_04425 [Rathayibacter toxicus]PPG23256.1 hypothetical protein C5D15_03185 [Rathayibacter toxicus]PPG47840.1 hypothetical protein C5D16_03180 [Rathayibacter toxicus]
MTNIADEVAFGGRRVNLIPSPLAERAALFVEGRSIGMSEQHARHSAGSCSCVQRTDAVSAGVLAAAVHSSDTWIRQHDIVRRCAAVAQGAVTTTAPSSMAARWARDGVRQHGGH